MEKKKKKVRIKLDDIDDKPPAPPPPPASPSPPPTPPPPPASPPPAVALRRSPLLSFFHAGSPEHRSIVEMLHHLGYRPAPTPDQARFVFLPFSSSVATHFDNPKFKLSDFSRVDVLPNELELLDLVMQNQTMVKQASPFALELYTRHAKGKMAGLFLERRAFGGTLQPGTALRRNPVDWYSPTNVLVRVPDRLLVSGGNVLIVFRTMVLVCGNGSAFMSSAIEALLATVPMVERSPVRAMDPDHVGVVEARKLMVEPVANAIQCFFASCDEADIFERYEDRQFRVLHAEVMAAKSDRATVVPHSVSFSLLQCHGQQRSLAHHSAAVQLQLQEMVSCMQDPFACQHLRIY